MKKISVYFVCFLMLSLMFKLSIANYHSCKDSCKNPVSEVSNCTKDHLNEIAFGQSKGEFEVIQAP